jgi:hypothetical protein
MLAFGLEDHGLNLGAGQEVFTSCLNLFLVRCYEGCAHNRWKYGIGGEEIEELASLGPI